MGYREKSGHHGRSACAAPVLRGLTYMAVKPEDRDVRFPILLAVGIIRPRQ